MLLTGPAGGPTDGVREFLLRLADEGLPSPAGGTSTRPAWMALTSTAPALVTAAAAMTGPEPPPALASATQN